MTFKIFTCVVFFISIPCITAIAQADDLTGKYHGKTLSLELTAKGANEYTGAIHLNHQDFPVTAQAQGNDLRGSFTSGGNEFPFTANLNGQQLTLQSGGATYQLEREVSQPVNPLAAGPAQPANPLAGGAAAPEKENTPSASSSDYTVLASTTSGKTLFAQKPAAKSAQAAIESTLPDLAHLFDGKPKIERAFADTKEHSQGIATFTARKNGKDIKGLILCGGGEKGEAVSVLYAATDAPATDWAKLNAALPSQTKMQTHEFPDGTGSVDLPEGWNTQSQSVLGGVYITGPADQIVTLGQGIEVVTPNSQMVQMQRQLEANARQWGGPPPPPMRLFVAPFSGPADALKNLVPQISQFSHMNGGPSITLDRIIESQAATANLPNGQAALMQYACTKGDGPSAIHYREIAQIECYPLSDQAWGVFFSELAAPESTFDRDAVTLWAIAHSFKTNDAVIQQRTQQTIQQNNQRFAAFEQSMKEKNDAFDSYMQSVRNRELVTSRSNANFDEVIRGYRTVEDTSTGEHTSVDLGKVDDVVNKLNESDPGRYKQIPLRDEQYPNPPPQAP